MNDFSIRNATLPALCSQPVPGRQRRRGEPEVPFEWDDDEEEEV